MKRTFGWVLILAAILVAGRSEARSPAPVGAVAHRQALRHFPVVTLRPPGCVARSYETYHPGAPGCFVSGVFIDQELDDMLANPAAWSRLRRYDIGMIVKVVPEVSDADLTRRVRGLMALNIPIEIEAEVFKYALDSTPAGIAQGAFEKNQKLLNRVLAAAGSTNAVRAMAVDDPLGHAHKRGVDSGIAADAIADLISLMHKNYPNILIVLDNPYPRFQPEDVQQQLTRIENDLSAAGVRGIDVYRMDNNWSAFDSGQGSWQGVRQIEAIVHKFNIPFNLIFWASGYPRSVKKCHCLSDQVWLDGLMREGGEQLAAGVHPDMFTIQSWIGAPSVAIPETLQTSFTGSALALLQAYGGQRLLAPDQQKPPATRSRAR